jgi:uncharacterized protein YacL (UPF0231 family)
MFRKLHLILAVALITVLYSCNSVPDNARYIPKNAIAVLGINTKEIGKKIAWNLITGSKLFDDIKKNQGATTLDPEEMGIELMGTTYVYIKSDKRFANGNKVTCLVPLDDAGKWMDFVKKTFPGVAIKEWNNRKSATLVEGMYASWNDDLLVIMNAIHIPQDYTALAADAETDTLMAEPAPVPPVVDETQIAAEMENAFTLTKENALTENKNFTKLEGKGHDITLWINYDEIMASYGNEGMTSITGMSLSNVLWKDAAFTAGFDFEDGRIAGDMHYYSPEEMKEVAKAMGKDNIDKEMLQMLPLKDPDFLFAWHLAPAGLKGTLEKLGVLGFINLALVGQNLNLDYILDAFTGDMAACVTDFKLVQQQAQPLVEVDADSVLINVNDSKYTSDGTLVYILKINKKENLDKLLAMSVANGTIQSAGAGVYTVGPSLSLMVTDKYMGLSNKKDKLQAVMQGQYSKDKAHEVISKSQGHPFTMFVNAASMIGAANPAMTSQRDSTMLAESRKLITNASFSGGEFKGDAFRYNMSINFTNKEENSLLQLMDFAIRMGDAAKQTTLATTR